MPIYVPIQLVLPFILKNAWMGLERRGINIALA
jgi:hypothetical protein